jgi:hypothetical protein
MNRHDRETVKRFNDNKGLNKMRSSPRRRPGSRRINGFLDPGFHRDDLFRGSLGSRYELDLLGGLGVLAVRF